MTLLDRTLPPPAIEPPAITFADVDEAMEALVRPVRLFVRIGGDVVDATEAHIRHDVDRMIGTCTVYLRAPRPAVVQMNAEIEIEMGYAGAVRRRFHGFIPDDESVSDNRGQLVRVQGVGWASRLAYPAWAGIEIEGPVSLKDAFRALCLLRGIPTFEADDTTYVNGLTTIMLGGNEQVDGGHLRMDNRTSPSDWLRRVPPLFGYRAFDSPDGAVRLARVSGLPVLSHDDVEPGTVVAGDRLTLLLDQYFYQGASLQDCSVGPLVPAETQMTALAGVETSPNLLNPSFATDISGWIERWNPAGFVYTATRDAGTFSDSAGSLQLAITAVPGSLSNLVYGPSESLLVPAQPGFEYGWTLAVRKDHATDLNVHIKIEFFDEGRNYIGEVQSDACPNVADTWHLLSITGIAPDAARWQMVTGSIYNTVTSIAATRHVFIDAANPASTSDRWLNVSVDGVGSGWIQAEHGGAPIIGTGDASVPHYQEGVNAYRMTRTRDRDRMVTFWEVLGARYTDTDGGAVQVRSIPESVPYAEELDPPGYIHRTLSSQDLVTATQADGARNAHEVDYSEVYEEVTWSCAGRPDLQPGDVVLVTGASHGLTAQPMWVMAIDEGVTDRGYIASRITAWRGAGQALPAGIDSVTIDVAIPGDGIAHLGNQTISWYADPSPDGTEMTIAIDVPYSDWTSLRLLGMAHGTNTYGTGNLDNPTTGSQIEIWQTQDGEYKRVGALTLPTLDEEYAKRRDYASSDRYWTQFSLPISGRLRQGAADLKIVAGTNPDGHDDFEVKNLQLVFAGVGVPDLPGSVS